VKAEDLNSDEEKDLVSDPVAEDKPGVARRGRGGEEAGPATRVARAQTSIRALYVREMDSGEMLGLASELILTATPGSARNDTPVRFATQAGQEMHMVLEDVLRAVRVKYPRWEASNVDLSFEDKYSPKDGGSIGAAIGTLLLSMIQGYEIDPNLAITGDVTADSKIRPIGGVAAKLRGATAGGCKIVVLPMGNYDQLVDAVVYEGPGLVTNIHVFGAGFLDQAAAVARVDREEKLAKEISEFEDLKVELKKSPQAVHSKEAQEKLSDMAEMAPNDLSVKLLTLAAQNKLPKRLSVTASQYYTFVAVNTAADSLFNHGKVGRGKRALTPAAVQEGLKRLEKVRRISDPAIIPMVDAWMGFIKALNDAETGKGSAQVLESKRQAVLDAMERVKADRDLMEKTMREGV
jgi:hypothetical protein